MKTEFLFGNNRFRSAIKKGLNLHHYFSRQFKITSCESASDYKIIVIRFLNDTSRCFEFTIVWIFCSFKKFYHLEFLEKATSAFSSFMWGYPLLVLLIGGGAFF